MAGKKRKESPDKIWTVKFLSQEVPTAAIPIVVIVMVVFFGIGLFLALFGPILKIFFGLIVLLFGAAAFRKDD